MPTLVRWFPLTLFTGCLLAAAPAERTIGDVIKADAAGGRIRIKLENGGEREIAVGSGTRCLRVAPGEKDLSQAVAITPADLREGDRVLVRGAAPASERLLAETIVVMTKGDITRKQEAERAEWNRRGIFGRVAAMDAAAGEIAVETSTAQGPGKLTVAVSGATRLRRYRPDSVKFGDARPSTLAELQVGDQMRALGRKSEDGDRYAAEEVVSGAFRTIAALVISTDAASGTLKATDLETKKPLLVRVTPESNLRKLAPMAAAMLAARLGPGGAAPSGPQQGRAPDLQTMLERMPAVTLDELKPGDAILVASTVGSTPGAVTAITLLAGVEPLLRKPSGEQTSALGSWNLDMNMNMSFP